MIETILLQLWQRAEGGDLEAQAIVGYINDLKRDKGKQEEIAASRLGMAEDAKRKMAEANQIRVTADNVKVNAQREKDRMWRLACDLGTALVEAKKHLRDPSEWGQDVERRNETKRVHEVVNAALERINEGLW